MGLERPDSFIEKQNPLIEKAYARTILSLQKEAPRMSTFQELYGEDNVRSDYEHVQKVKHDIAERRRENPQFEDSLKYGTIFEGIMDSEIELSNWLGDNAHSLHTTEYDDIVNGIDEVVEFREENSASYLGLALDVTFGTQSVEDKIKRIKTEFDNGKLGQVKYFQSDFTHITGRLSNIPRVVVSTDRETVEELTQLWMANDGRGDRKALAEHPMQIRMLNEIENQLSVYHSYLLAHKSSETNKVRKERFAEMAVILEERMKVVSQIKDEKRNLVARLQEQGKLGEDKDQGFLSLNNALISAFPDAADNHAPLTLKEKMDAQRALIRYSGMDPMEWIDAYSERFRRLSENPEICRMLRENFYDSLPLIMERLDQEKAA